MVEFGQQIRPGDPCYKKYPKTHFQKKIEKSVTGVVQTHLLTETWENFTTMSTNMSSFKQKIKMANKTNKQRKKVYCHS